MGTNLHNSGEIEDRLRFAEERLRDFVDSAADRIWETDDQFRITYISQPRDGTSQIPPEQVIGKRLWELKGARPASGSWRNLEDCVARREPFKNFQMMMDGRDGQQVHVKVSGKPYYDADGAYLGYRAAGLDVSAEVMAAQRLHKTEELLRHAVEYAPEGIVLWDRDDRLVLWNSKFAEIHDYASDVLVPGTSFADFMALSATKTVWPRDEYPDWSTETADLRRRITADRENVAIRAMAIVNGRYLLISRHRLPDGGIIAFQTDVTELTQRNKELLESEERFESAFQLLPLPASITRVDGGEMVDVNAAWLEALGYERGEAVGVNAKKLGIMVDFTEDVRDDLIGQLDGGARSAPFMAKLKTKSGEIRNYRCHVAQIIQLSGEKHLLTISEDVTDQLQQEAQFRQAQKMEAVGRLTGGIAHDFNNLLTGIMGNLELIERLSTERGVVERAEKATASAQRAARLTTRLLDYARAHPAHPEPTAINGTVNGMLEILVQTLGERYPVELDLDAGCEPIKVDQNQLENAIMNLVLNARDAMPDGGKINITTENLVVARGADELAQECPAGRYTRLTVSDTGMGILPEDRSHIFEPFFTTKGLGEGSGLGLSTVYGFVSQSEGHIQLKSEINRGTSLSLSFPVIETGEVALSNTDESPEIEPPQGNGEVILLVEDDPEVMDTTSTMLRNLGYQVINGGDGSDLAAKLDDLFDIDLLLTDVILSHDLTGPMVAAQALEKRKDLNVLMTTGYSNEYLGRSTPEAPQFPILRKPFTLAELAKSVAGALAHGAAAS